MSPYNGIKENGPYKRTPYKLIHFFCIFHQNDRTIAESIIKYLNEGHGFFKGINSFVGVPVHIEPGFSFTFVDKDNPLPEIEAKLNQRAYNPQTRYLALYLTPHSKHNADPQKKEIYYKVKEALLKRGITSQCIETEKITKQNFVYSLSTISISILAKLNGMPWCINTPAKNELIVGIGAFKNIEKNVQYIGSAFSFNNTGHFNRFEYFAKNETEELAGSIERSIIDYVSINTNIERLIIHFYKEMSDEEYKPIERVLQNLDLGNLPVYIVTIKKTESEDIIIFDKDYTELIPESGTYINIDENTFLLCNNTRYPNTEAGKEESYPFPIKLQIECSDPTLLRDTNTVKDLIDQVYQFSRIYWKSLKQQNLPVTIKYPEMVAQIAPHFDGLEIPDAGKDNLWFL